MQSLGADEVFFFLTGSRWGCSSSVSRFWWPSEGEREREREIKKTRQASPLELFVRCWRVATWKRKGLVILLHHLASRSSLQTFHVFSSHTPLFFSLVQFLGSILSPLLFLFVWPVDHNWSIQHVVYRSRTTTIAVSRNIRVLLDCVLVSSLLLPLNYSWIYFIFYAFVWQELQTHNKVSSWEATPMQCGSPLLLYPSHSHHHNNYQLISTFRSRLIFSVRWVDGYLRIR
jgi:hypothetical protein